MWSTITTLAGPVAGLSSSPDRCCIALKIGGPEELAAGLVQELGPMLLWLLITAVPLGNGTLLEPNAAHQGVPFTGEPGVRS